MEAGQGKVEKWETGKESSKKLFQNGGADIPVCPLAGKNACPTKNPDLSS